VTRAQRRTTRAFGVEEEEERDAAWFEEFVFSWMTLAVRRLFRSI
jgi:hypothetical protein